MSLSDALSHLIGFVVPAILQGLLTASLAKLIWRRELARKGWIGLACGGAVAALVALTAGLVLTDHDGTMAAYGAMVVATALGVGWLGFVRR
jgi:hypothetical protein